eukprot:scaffold1.g5400.t1
MSASQSARPGIKPHAGGPQAGGPCRDDPPTTPPTRARARRFAHPPSGQRSVVDGLDLVVHAGDYIYEYPKGEYPGPRFQARHGLRPKHRCESLDDFRQRYACYRTARRPCPASLFPPDPALQKLHQMVPWVATWDDHEMRHARTRAAASLPRDSVWRTGAEDLKGMPQERFQKLKRQAAFIEYVPVRGMPHDNISLAGVQRAFHFGDLASLHMFENRLAYRDQPVDLSETEFYKLTAKKEQKDWDDDAIAEARRELLDQLRDPERRMIGDRQVENVRRTVADSVEGGRPWQILVSQTVLSQISAPKLQQVLDLQPRLLRRVTRAALNTATSEKRAGKEGAELARMYLALGTFGLPMNPDAWDGYEAERERLLAALNQQGANPIILAGDSHNAWAHELLDRDGHRLGVEFDGPAVTSVGAFEDIYSRFVEKAGCLAKLCPLFLFTPFIEDALFAANPDTLKFCNLDQRGFVLFHVTRRRVHAEYHFVNSVAHEGDYKHHCQVLPGALTQASTRADWAGHWPRASRVVDRLASPTLSCAPFFLPLLLQAAFDTEVGHKGRLLDAVRYLTIGGKVPKKRHQRRVGFLRGLRALSAGHPQ